MDEKRIERLASSVGRVAGKKVMTNFTGSKAWVVVHGIKDLKKNSDEVVQAVFEITKALRKNRSDLSDVGIDSSKAKAQISGSTLLVGMPFSGVINDATPVLEKALKKVGSKVAADPIDLDELPKENWKIIAIMDDFRVSGIWSGIHGYIINFEGSGSVSRMDKRTMKGLASHPSFRWLDSSRSGSFSVGC